MPYWICIVGNNLLFFGSVEVIALSSTYFTDLISDEAASVAAGNTVIKMKVLLAYLYPALAP